MAGNIQPPSGRPKYKALKIQVASHVDVRVNFYIHLSPRVWVIMTALGAGGGGWLAYLQQ